MTREILFAVSILVAYGLILYVLKTQANVFEKYLRWLSLDRLRRLEDSAHPYGQREKDSHSAELFREGVEEFRHIDSEFRLVRKQSFFASLLVGLGTIVSLFPLVFPNSNSAELKQLKKDHQVEVEGLTEQLKATQQQLNQNSKVASEAQSKLVEAMARNLKAEQRMAEMAQEREETKEALQMFENQILDADSQHAKFYNTYSARIKDYEQLTKNVLAEVRRPVSYTGDVEFLIESWLKKNAPQEMMVAKAVKLESRIPGNLISIADSIQLDEVAEEFSLNGNGMVSVLVGGLANQKHRDFQERLVNLPENEENDYSAELTHVAGIVAADYVDVGIAPNSSIYAIESYAQVDQWLELDVTNVASLLVAKKPSSDELETLITQVREQHGAGPIIVIPLPFVDDDAEVLGLDPGLVVVGDMPDPMVDLIAPGEAVASTGSGETGQSELSGPLVSSGVACGVVALMQELHLRKTSSMAPAKKIKEWMVGGLKEDGTLDLQSSISKMLIEIEQTEPEEKPAQVEDVPENRFAKIELEPVLKDFGLNSETESRTLSGSGQKVAIVGTGVSSQHPDFAERLTVEDLTTAEAKLESPVGTHAAGVIAARMGATKGIAVKSSILSLRIIPQSGEDTAALILKALARCEEEVESSGLSVVFLDFQTGVEPAIEVQKSISRLVSNGVAVIAPAGNNESEMSYPAKLEDVISVGALAFEDQHNTNSARLASYSSRSLAENVELLLDSATGQPQPMLTTVFAPGGPMISSSIEPSQLTSLSGTSVAASQVVGVTLLLQEFWKHYTGVSPQVKQLKSWLQSPGAIRMDSTTRRPLYSLDCRAVFQSCRQDLKKVLLARQAEQKTGQKLDVKANQKK